MKGNRSDWQNDPVVRMEKLSAPVLPGLLLALMPEGRLAPEVRHAANVLAEAWRNIQAGYLDDHEVTLSADGADIARSLATRLDALADEVDLAKTPEDRRAVAEAIVADVAPRIEAALDLLRASFIQAVLDRQAKAREMSEVAAREVAAISRQIYFISINASVEAARAGAAGRGFSVIGEQIRVLSQDASSALDRMKVGRGAP